MTLPGEDGRENAKAIWDDDAEPFSIDENPVSKARNAKSRLASMEAEDAEAEDVADGDLIRSLIERYGLRVGVNDLNTALKKQRAYTIAREVVKQEMAAASWAPPWLGGSNLLSEQMLLERDTPKYLFDRLLGYNHNCVLAAQFGSGKTTLGLNMVRCLVDGRPFLGREVGEFSGRVGWINGEMDKWDWIDYTKPMKIKNLDRIAPLHFRHDRLPIMDDVVAEQFVKWLIDHEVRVLVLDSWRRLCAWNGVDENVNAEVEQITARIDQIKAESGVHAFLALAHTGRRVSEEGDERVRGATALDDWIDSRWVMVKQGSVRFFWADKRQVEMPETALEFDELKLRVSLGSGNRRETAGEEQQLKILLELQRCPGLSTSRLEEAVSARNGSLKPVLTAMEVRGEVRSEKGKTNGFRWFLKS